MTLVSGVQYRDSTFLCLTARTDGQTEKSKTACAAGKRPSTGVTVGYKAHDEIDPCADTKPENLVSVPILPPWTLPCSQLLALFETFLPFSKNYRDCIFTVDDDCENVS